MRGYPSGFIELCRLTEKMQLCKKFRLKAVYLTSENFSADEKAYISSFLECPVYGQYGHTECSIFATQGPSDMQYIASPLYGYTEVINEEGEHVEIGARGEVVVTGFSQLGLPFIRYKTGDLAIYGGRNKYGETILSMLLGRTIDYIYNNKGEKVYTVGFIFGGHLKAFNSIRNWQIEQNEKGRLLIRIVKGDDFNKERENDLITFFAQNNFNIEINYVEGIPRTQRGKQLFLIQNCK
jgi:phenylacetate-CoA ligase